MYSMMMGDDPKAYELESASLTLQDSLPLSSAHRANIDDESSEEDYDDDSTTTTQQSRSNRRHKNNRNNRNRFNNSQNDGAILLEDNSRSSLNRSGKIFNKLRKNDVVKVVDTPSGRAGFVYQSASNPVINTKTNNVYSSSSATKLSSSSSMSNSNNNYPPYVNRNANDVKLSSSYDSAATSDETNQKKILPVLTSDGKIALVVRGDPSRNYNENVNVNGSGSSIGSRKYEPITNMTSIITALNNNNDNNNVNNRQNDSITTLDANDPLRSLQEQNRMINRLDEFFASVTNKVKKLEEVAEQDLSIDVDRGDGESANVDEKVDESQSMTSTFAPSSSTTEPTMFEEDASRKNLLQINRPLSEVLGLPKKTYYNHPIESFNADTTKLPTTRQHSHSTEQQIVRRPNVNSSSINTPKLSTEGSVEEFDHESPEVINIAVIPGFDSEMEKKLFGYDRNNNQNDQTSDASETIRQCSKSLRIMIVVVWTAFVAFQ